MLSSMTCNHKVEKRVFESAKEQTIAMRRNMTAIGFYLTTVIISLQRRFSG